MLTITFLSSVWKDAVGFQSTPYQPGQFIWRIEVDASPQMPFLHERRLAWSAVMRLPPSFLRHFYLGHIITIYHASSPVSLLS